MNFLYILALLPVLAAAAPAPVPSGYYLYPKRATDPVLAKRQVTVADLKRRAQESSDYKDSKPGRPSGYYPPTPTQGY